MLEIAKVVEVELVVVELRPVKFWRVEEPLARKLLAVMRAVDVRLPPLPVVKNRLVDEAVVAKKLVVVAEVPVAVVNVKFCKVDEALMSRLLAVRVPVRVSLPPLLVVKKKFEVEAFVEKKLVVVALVPVALTKVKFCKVVEALAKKLFAVTRAVEVRLPPEAVVKNRLVVLAFVENRLVVVAEVPVALTKVKF